MSNKIDLVIEYLSGLPHLDTEPLNANNYIDDLHIFFEDKNNKFPLPCPLSYGAKCKKYKSKNNSTKDFETQCAFCTEVLFCESFREYEKFIYNVKIKTPRKNKKMTEIKIERIFTYLTNEKWLDLSNFNQTEFNNALTQHLISIKLLPCPTEFGAKCSKFLSISKNPEKHRCSVCYRATICKYTKNYLNFCFNVKYNLTLTRKNEYMLQKVIQKLVWYVLGQENLEGKLDIEFYQGAHEYFTGESATVPCPLEHGMTCKEYMPDPENPQIETQRNCETCFKTFCTQKSAYYNYIRVLTLIYCYINVNYY